MDRIQVAAGTTVGVSIRLINMSKAIWGQDAREFVPTRWLSPEGGLPDQVKDIHGYSHLLTFVDGPRMCLGKQFAILEFKVSSLCMVFVRYDSDWQTQTVYLGNSVNSHSQLQV